MTETTETGIEVYAYRHAPWYLLTRRQLRRLGLSPGKGRQEIAAEIRWRRGLRVAYLFDVGRAERVRPMTKAQARALDAAMRARRTCAGCRVVQDYCIPTSRGMCVPCFTGETVVDDDTPPPW
ncbi:RRQRL motif-containing zinc-binding protein [Embleya sp. NPDC127516]|uniref:RRQRL motif-containing zinc-binding protein n=1 Tax=Embleya sp. NPDC127516 TaxID=3363990 RepID=UPI00382ED687